MWLKVSADVELCELTVRPCAACRVFEVFALTGLFCAGRLFDFLQVSLPDTLITSDIHNVNPHKHVSLFSLKLSDVFTPTVNMKKTLSLNLSLQTDLCKVNNK